VSGSNGSGGSLSARELALAAKETVRDLIGYPPETVSGLRRDGDAWFVTVDVCEVERIPSTADVMATYVVELDEGGELLGYRRERRFERGRAEAG
jgi:hypothetical protein